MNQNKEIEKIGRQLKTVWNFFINPGGKIGTLLIVLGFIGGIWVGGIFWKICLTGLVILIPTILTGIAWFFNNMDSSFD